MRSDKRKIRMQKGGSVKFFGSYESKVIKVAMDALRVTAETVPEGSPEHFPPPGSNEGDAKREFFP